MGQTQCPGNRTVGDATCLACHTGISASDVSLFPQSPHNHIDCETCHGPGYLHVRNGGQGGILIENPGDQPFTQAINFCADCHEDQVDGFLKTAHGEEQVFNCSGCHDVHRPEALAVATETELLDIPGYAALCGDCHVVQTDTFLLSGHATLQAATCRACHNMHVEDTLTASPVDNSLCLQCHASEALGFTSEAIIDAHTGEFHPVDPAGSGASRCVGCHLPPLAQNDATAPHDHTLFTIPPAVTIEAFEENIFPVPPNSCAGVAGCHDPAVPGSGIPHDVTNLAVNELLQAVYEATWGDPDVSKAE
jgi:hypothetical protein